jgi:hypothetical protein
MWPSGTSLFDTAMQGTTFVTADDHAARHRELGSLGNNIGAVFGTSAGTNLLLFVDAAGEFVPAVNASNVFQDPMGGTFNNSTFGTVAMTGGTFNNGIFGTPTLQAPTINGQGTNSGTLSGGLYGTAQWTGGTINPIAGSIDIIENKVTIAGSISNSTTPGTLYTYTIPANQLGTSGWLNTEMWGKALNTSGTNMAVTIATMYNGSTIVSTTRSFASGGGTIDWYLTTYLANQGTTNAQLGGFFFAGQEVTNGGNYMNSGNGTSGIDSTVAGTFKVVFTSNIANTNAWLTLLSAKSTLS